MMNYGTSDAEIAKALTERNDQQRAAYRDARLRRFLEAGFDVGQSELLELAGIACHDAEELRSHGCDVDLAMRILL